MLPFGTGPPAITGDRSVQMNTAVPQARPQQSAIIADPRKASKGEGHRRYELILTTDTTRWKSAFMAAGMPWLGLTSK